MSVICRLIAPEWLKVKEPGIKTLEGYFIPEKIQSLNAKGYNIYYLPNYPSNYQSGTVDGSQIDTFTQVFIDFDLKSNTYPTKDAFIEAVANGPITPSRIVDSGGGVHVYWQVSDLDPISYLRLSRRLTRYYKTDEAVGKIYQLMRLPGTLNTKFENDFRPCEILFEDEGTQYTCEQLDKAYPPIIPKDEEYCQQHFNKTYSVDNELETVNDTLPAKFGALLAKNHEVKAIWSGNTSDRSKDDYRLGHLMFANDFTKDEAMSVLVNSAKAMARAPKHRIGYAKNIIDKIWTFEQAAPNAFIPLSNSVADILKRDGSTLKGTPFRCHKRIDNTVHGFRLGQVIGLVAGVGVGKTAFSLNMFNWFGEANPDYHHFFVPLEQPDNEVADRWKTMCQGDNSRNNKVHILSNYDANGNFRHLSFDEIREYIENWQKTTGNKVGCVVIDHIGALKKKGAKDENQDLMTICHNMKAFAIQLNVLLVMQSQASREKAGIGDLELNKDAAYGTVFFESYCDYLITMWQPLKRCHAEEACPTVAAFKFCKIRHKKAREDVIKEDVPYFFYFDSKSELLRDMTQDEETSFKFFLPKATNKRKADRKTDLIEYQSVPYNKEPEGDENVRRIH